MATLVTLQQAKDHLQLPTLPDGHPDEADLQLKLDEAEAIILGYLAAKADPAWLSPETAPKEVTAAIKLMLGGLYRHRGDLMEADPALWAAIDRVLTGIRFAALA